MATEYHSYIRFKGKPEVSWLSKNKMQLKIMRKAINNYLF